MRSLSQQPTAQRPYLTCPADTPTRLRLRRACRHRHLAGPHPAAAGALSRSDRPVLLDSLGAVDLRENDLGACAARAARRCARHRRQSERAGRAAAEARRHRERNPVAHARRSRRRRDRRVGGKRRAGDPAQRRRRRAQVLRAVRSARRLVESRRLRRRRHDLQHPAQGSSLGRSRRIRCCSRAASRSPPGYVLYGSSTVFVLTIGLGVDMFVLDPAYGAFIRVAQGLQIPQREQVLLGERRQSPELSRRAIRTICRGRRSTATRAATSARWSRTCIASCCRAACSCIRRRRRRRRASCA